LRIIAEIDGVDELHLNASAARWFHLEYQMPESVSINGREWDPSRLERWVVEGSELFLDPDVDLAGATVTLVRGRGEIAFHHGEDGLVLTFDDSLGGGADEYEVLVEFADVLCAQRAVVGDPDPSALQRASELRIEARIDGRDELHLGPRRADWLHLAWSWPTAIRVGGLPWDPEPAPLSAPLPAPPGTLFFSPTIDLEHVAVVVEKGRGHVELAAAGDRLFLSFDDDADFGADDYAVRLCFPESPRNPQPRLPTGPALRVLLEHRPAADVAGAVLTVLARSPASGEYVPWPGLRGMDSNGRCVLALPEGTYRLELLHRPSSDRLVALRTRPVRVTGARTVALPAAEASAVVWRDGEAELELRELAVHSLLGEGEVSWTREALGADLHLVASPREEFSLRALGGGENTCVAWWTRRRFGDRALLDSTTQSWIRCGFEGHGAAPLPADCRATLHSPRSEFSFPVGAETRLLTNRRFVGFSYRHSIEDGGTAVFRQHPVLLPETGGRHRFELGGELTAWGSAAILQNENLGSPDARELWWQLDLVDPAGRVVDPEASDIEWRAQALMRDGSPMPRAPLEDDAVRRLGDPAQSVALAATYRWNGTHEVTVDPAPPVLSENERYRSEVPGHLGSRAEAYLDKARRTYHAIEAARGKPGDHTAPIELKWWLNGGAVGVWGSITMPIAGLTDDDDWFAFPWALAHESLHAFGYPHGPELDRLDLEAMALFERMTWEAESDPGFVPEGW